MKLKCAGSHVICIHLGGRLSIKPILILILLDISHSRSKGEEGFFQVALRLDSSHLYIVGSIPCIQYVKAGATLFPGNSSKQLCFDVESMTHMHK